MPTESPDEDRPENPPETVRPDLKRSLKDLLVQEDMDDSDIEMLEKQSDEDKLEDDDVVDPEMCVECGDQVSSQQQQLIPASGNVVQSMPRAILRSLLQQSDPPHRKTENTYLHPPASRPTPAYILFANQPPLASPKWRALRGKRS
jgi:hypothetical protein